MASAVPVAPVAEPAVAALPDGGLAFATFDDVWAVRPSGRLELLSRPRDFRIPHDIVAGADGSVYVAFGNPGTSRRITPTGADTIVVRASGGCEVDAMDIATDGSLLFVACRGVWRLAPDGRLELVAGRADARDRAPVPEGSPAVGAAFLGLVALASLPDGGYVFSEAARHTWRVASDGTIRTFLDRRARGLQALGDGSVLLSAPTHLRRAVDGRTTAVAGSGETLSHGNTALLAGRRERLTSFDGDAGDPRAAPIAAGSVSVTRDGGIVFSDQTRIRYLPPTRPELLAVGIARPTVSTRRRVRVTVATTPPASVTATVAHHGRAERRPEWRWLRGPDRTPGRLGTAPRGVSFPRGTGWAGLMRFMRNPSA